MKKKKNEDKSIDEHVHHIAEKTQDNIKAAFIVNLLFAILEFIGGLLTNSISIFSDAIHDMGDSFSIAIAYILEKKSKKNADETYTFGYLRYSLIGALLTSLVLLIGSGFVIVNAIPRLFHPEEVNHDAMIIFAIFGVMINAYAAYKTSKGIKHNEKSINLHMLEDVFGWLSILIGSVIIKTTGYIIIDPILSILIAIFLLFHVYKNLKEIFDIFMEKVPRNINIDEIKENIISKFDEVKNIHHIHVWSIDGVNNCMTAHVMINKEISFKEIIKLKENIKNELENNKIIHVTLEIEFPGEKCKNHDF